MVLLDCSEPHIEAAVVYGVRPTSLLVFVPKFHMKGSVHLTDRAGLVRLPLTAPGQNTDDPFAVSERRQFRLETGITCGRTLCLALHPSCVYAQQGKDATCNHHTAAR